MASSMNPNPNPNPNSNSNLSTQGLSLADQQFLLMMQFLGVPPQPQVVSATHHPSIHPGMLPMQQQMQMLHNATPAPFHFLQPPLVPAFPPAYPPVFPVQHWQPPPPPATPAAAPASVHHENSAAFSVADEIILARAVYEKKEKNLEEVFSLLDGKNGHNVTKWMSYYVKNTRKIHQRMKDLETHSSRNDETSNSHPASFPSQFTTRRQTREKAKNDTVVASRQSASLRRLRAAKQSPPPRLHWQDISHTPTPPRNIVKTPQGGHRFTDEDITYLRKELARALMSDPDALTPRKAICAKLEANAPHHSAKSWMRYLLDHEYIISEVQQEVLRLKKKQSNSIDEDASFNASEEESVVGLSSSENERGLRHQDIKFKQSFGSRSTYLPSERRALAKYIAQISLAQWDNKPGSWISFQRKYNTHSLDQWRDWYRRNQDSVHHMARRFEVRMAKRKAAQLEQGPTCPKPSSRHTGPPALEKRAYEIDEDAFELRAVKRSRTNASTTYGAYQLKKSSPFY